ncbi:chitosanase [Pseudonocardia sp. T1-2H]|uniref:chitosanase n=1 Tax=Pseudonocardia sp. T1-2H TaxID=3128899 RepID=UPI00310174D8
MTSTPTRHRPRCGCAGLVTGIRRRKVRLVAAGLGLAIVVGAGAVVVGTAGGPAGGVRIGPAADPSAAVTSSAAAPPSTTGPPPPVRDARLAVAGHLGPDQRRIADQLVSVFENDTPVIQYDYVEDLGDGRGITAGRAGFCSGCGDMLEVVRRYAEVAPDSDLAGYLSELKAAADGDDADLGGLDAAWRRAAADARFRAIQDAVVEQFYFGPAAALAAGNGLRTALGVAVLYDTAVQHGTGSDHDSVRGIVDRTNEAMNGSPADGVDEVAWLGTFLGQRRAVLENPSSAATAKAWGESTGRVDALGELLRQGELALVAPLVVSPWGTARTLG